jgi:hypothetical protein
VACIILSTCCRFCCCSCRSRDRAKERREGINVDFVEAVQSEEKAKQADKVFTIGKHTLCCGLLR